MNTTPATPPMPRQRAPRITLATPCTATGCGHAYNWHSAGRCSVTACGCTRFEAQAEKVSVRRTPPGMLSAAELRVVQEVARGGTRQEIAARLGLRPMTVKTHLHTAARVLCARSTSHLVAIAIRSGQLRADVAAGSEVSR